MTLEEDVQMYLKQEGINEITTSCIYEKVSAAWGIKAQKEVEELLIQRYYNQILSDAFYSMMAREINGISLYDLLAGRMKKGIAWDIRSIMHEIERPHKQILDIGCGTGLITCFVAKYCPDINITAIDSSKEILAISCNRAQKLGIFNINFINKTLEDFYWTAGKYDIVLAAHVIDEDSILDALGNLRERRFALLLDAVSPNGKIVIIDNDNPIKEGYAEEREVSHSFNLGRSSQEKLFYYNDIERFGVCHRMQVYY